MTFDEFADSLGYDSPPKEVGDLLKALWHDRNGDWDRAHRIVQEMAGTEAAWVHAFLHRKEGDLGNAGYWYRKAQQPVCEASLEREWEDITRSLLRG